MLITANSSNEVLHRQASPSELPVEKRSIQRFASPTKIAQDWDEFLTLKMLNASNKAAKIRL